MYLKVLILHQIVTFLFIFYILVDRIYIRNYVNEDIREDFYVRIKYPMAFLTLFIVLTGSYLLLNNFTPLQGLKAVLSLLLIFLFFYCPFFMKKDFSKVIRFFYRAFVFILTFVVLYLGLKI